MHKIFVASCLGIALVTGTGISYLVASQINNIDKNQETSSDAETTSQTENLQNTVVTFTLNVHDFSYPEKSATILEKLITAHEERSIPVEVFLTTTMIDEFSENYPDFWNHLTTSPMVDISYHIRPPVPYHNVAAETIDWSSMTNTEIYDTIFEYETHGLDLITGTPTSESGSFKKLTELLGHPARCVGAASGPETGEILHKVFFDLGATCIVENAGSTNLGEYREKLWVRPQHVDIKFFEEHNAAPEELIAQAQSAAQNQNNAKAPYFLNIKMHDNDFFAEDSAWTTVYLAPGVRRNGPPYDTSLKSPLLSEAEQADMLSDYVALLDAVKNNHNVSILNLTGVAELFKK
jgi:hypothetical protein